MTDLTKGIIEINGFEINPETQSYEIEKLLAEKITSNMFTKSKKGQGIFFENIPILGRNFNLDLFFYLGKLDNIRLDYTNEECLSFEELFVTDCQWLRDILGEPAQTGTNGVVYQFGSVQVGVTNLASDGRSGPDEFVKISYR